MGDMEMEECVNDAGHVGHVGQWLENLERCKVERMRV